MFIGEAIVQGSTDLKFAGIGTPSLDATLLLSHVLKTCRSSLIAKGSEELSQEVCAEFCKLIERRAAGECVAYIIGKKEFRGLEFIVNPSVLVPRPDTETLVEVALEIIKKILPQSFTEGEKIIKPKPPCSSVSSVVKNLKVLDLCTGCGAIAIALKHEVPQLEVWATDISAEALKVAKQNSKNLLPSSSKIHFLHGDLYDACSSSNSSFNIIISNPPYIASKKIQTLSAEVQNEPRLALDGGNDGLEIIKCIIEGAPNYLQNGGILLLEADPHQMEEITILLERKKFKDIQLFKDLGNSFRVIGSRYEK